MKDSKQKLISSLQNSSVVGSPTAAGATRSSRDTASTAEDRGTAASGVAGEVRGLRRFLSNS